MRKYLFFFILPAVIFSCVQNKELVYLQNKEGYTGFPRDSVISRHEMYKYQYRLQPGDIISVNIASLTSEEFDFYRKYIVDLGPLLRTPTPVMGAGRGRGNRNRNRGGNNNRNRNRNSTSGFMVSDSGNIHLPLMGKIPIEGCTLEEAETLISQRARGYFEDPMVRINLQNFQVTMLGEVNNEGIVTTFDPETNIYEAFSLAGNLTEMADRSNVKIIRKNEDQAKTIYVNTLKEEYLTSENFYLKPGDIVVVPPLKVREINRYTLPNYKTLLSTISSTLVLFLTIDRITNGN